MKKKLIAIAILIGICLMAAGAYWGYGAIALVNPNSVASIHRNFCKVAQDPFGATEKIDKNRPITVLAKEQYKDNVFILYTNPVMLEQYPKSWGFIKYKKHKLYKNRYQYVGIALSSIYSNNGTSVLHEEIDRTISNGKTRVTCLIANVNSEEKQCSIFEGSDEEGFIKKIEVMEVPQNQVYIIFKEFEIDDKEHDILVMDGNIPLKLLRGEE